MLPYSVSRTLLMVIEALSSTTEWFRAFILDALFHLLVHCVSFLPISWQSLHETSLFYSKSSTKKLFRLGAGEMTSNYSVAPGCGAYKTRPTRHELFKWQDAG